jgi:hypothetical protein
MSAQDATEAPPGGTGEIFMDRVQQRRRDRRRKISSSSGSTDLAWSESEPTR